jgi:orotidine-5'-phosphate decarboxylase
MIVRPEERIIVALDVNNFHDLHVLLQKLQGTSIWGVKLGLELCTAVGAPAAVAMATGHGYRVMLDLKFGDIPNTTAGAARSAASLGVEMFTIHASAGRESIAAAVKNCGNSQVLAVTVLTSIDDTECSNIFGNSTQRTVIQSRP